MKQQTQEVISKYKNFSKRVPIVQIASDLGIDVYETKELEDTQSGSITKMDDGSFVIYVNANHPTTRKRFTIAHEVAHFLEHQDYFNENNEHISSYKQPIASLDRAEYNSNEKMEKEANNIAAEILMPEAPFKRVWDESDKISEVADRFVVSQSAAAIRGATICRSMFI